MRFLRIACATIGLCAWTVSQATSAALTIEPRLATGIADYDLNIDEIVIVDAGGDSVFGIDFEDTLFFAGGGLTFNYKRFFFDLSGQYSFDGQDQIDAALVLDDDAVAVEFLQDVDFDRIETLATLGYRVTHQFTAYLGFRYAKAVFDGSGTQGDADTDFKTELSHLGPVVGAGYVAPDAFWDGALVISGALTYLDGELENEVDTNDPFNDVDFDVDGTSIGLNAGISWVKPLSNGLRFVFGADFSRYKFEDDDDETDFDETISRLRTELRYSF